MMKRMLIFLFLILFITPVLAQQPSDKFLKDFKQAEKYDSERRFEEALKIYKSLIPEAEKTGFGVELKLLTARTLYNLGRYTEAINLLTQILEQDIPRDGRYCYLEPQVKFSLGLCYFQTGESQRAARYMNEAVELGGIGVADYLVRREYKTAVDHLEEVRYPVTHLFLARSLMQMNIPEFFPQVHEKLSGLQEVLTLSEIVDFSTGEFWFTSGDFLTARERFRTFINKYPESHLKDYAQYYLACCWLHEGENRKAIDNLEGLLDPNKNRILAAHSFFIRGEAYYDEGIGLDTLGNPVTKDKEMVDSARFSYEKARSILPHSMVDFFATYRLYELYKADGMIELAGAEATRLKEIAMIGREQRLHEDLANYVKGITEFERHNYREAAQNFYEIVETLPEEDASIGIKMIYEIALVIDILTYNRLGHFDAMIATTANYLNFFPEPLEYKYGKDWRAYLLYNFADAKYFLGGRIEREEAKKIYGDIIRLYPTSFVAPLAGVSLAWYDLEGGFYDVAFSKFDSIIRTTGKRDAIILALYGAGLSLFYKGDSASVARAIGYFCDEEAYRKLKITTKRGAQTLEIRYNELADSLIDDNLWYRALCFDRLKFYGDALAEFERLMDEYPAREKTGLAAGRVIKYYIRAKKIDEAESKLEDLKAKKSLYRDIKSYEDSYGTSLAALYGYYRERGDLAKAEEYGKRLRSELGTVRYLEEFYYEEGLKDTTVEQIPHLEEIIASLRGLNEYSEYLPDLIFSLAYLYIKKENYEDAKNLLLQLKSWPRPISATLVPRISYQLGTALYRLGRYDDAIRQFKDFVKDYADPKKEEKYEPELAPWGYYLLAQAELARAEEEKSAFIQKEYYESAKRNFQHLKDTAEKEYAKEEQKKMAPWKSFYSKVKGEVEANIKYCERKLR